MVQIYGSGTTISNTAQVDSDGRLLVSISGTIHIGSVSANVDSLYIQSGNNMHFGSAWTNIGSVLVSNADAIGSLGVQTVSGVFNTVWVGVGSVVISGTSIPPTRGIGSVQLVPGSLEVYQTIADDLDVNISAFPLFDLGSPGIQQTTYIITSGTYVSEVWSPGTGSKVEIHGWEISSDVPQEARLVLSGTAGGFVTIGRYRLPASGTILKTLVHPITPGVANEGLGLGTTVTGSTDITIYGRDKK
ncbi:MAG: hypothetical protein IH948_04645 [Bacteroidetes bacterium]|nr:hypothetical protein [Bacteroidota bacterium]